MLKSDEFSVIFVCFMLIKEIPVYFFTLSHICCFFSSFDKIVQKYILPKPDLNINERHKNSQTDETMTYETDSSDES